MFQAIYPNYSYGKVWENMLKLVQIIKGQLHQQGYGDVISFQPCGLGVNIVLSTIFKTFIQSFSMFVKVGKKKTK